MSTAPPNRRERLRIECARMTTASAPDAAALLGRQPCAVGLHSITAGVPAGRRGQLLQGHREQLFTQRQRNSDTMQPVVQQSHLCDEVLQRPGMDRAGSCHDFSLCAGWIMV